MNKNIKVNNKGFTIVETLIVLAIAAVIIIIVLLAVPALQRSARNSSIKNDATTISGTVSDYTSANNGSVPNNMSVKSNGDYYLCYNATATTAEKVSSNTTCTATGSSIASISTGDVVYENDGGVSVTYSSSAGSTTSVAPGYVLVDFGATCATTTGAISTSSTAATGSSSNNNATAIFYPVETGSGTGGIWCLQG